MSTLNAPASTLAGAYLAEGIAGTELPGAPSLVFKLVVVPASQRVTGAAEILQALAPPFGQILIPNVQGHIWNVKTGSATHLVMLEGTYAEPTTEKATSTVLEQFRASLAVDNNWNGRGSFSYGSHRVDDVPVRRL